LRTNEEMFSSKFLAFSLSGGIMFWMWVAHDAALVVGDALVGGDGGVAGGGHPAEPLVRAFRFRYILNCCPRDVARCGTSWQLRVRKERWLLN
jgi:hypothetical protein